MTFSAWHSRHDETSIKIPAIGLDLRARLPPSASGGALTIIETTNAPGFGPPLHRHAETEVFRILQGRYLYEVDGRRFHAETGDVISVPGGAAHAFVNVTDAPGQQLVVIVPGLDAAAFFTAYIARGAATELSDFLTPISCLFEFAVLVSAVLVLCSVRVPVAVIWIGFGLNFCISIAALLVAFFLQFKCCGYL
jgi:quercetin dioxygenase-like cupin family protein